MEPNDTFSTPTPVDLTVPLLARVCITIAAATISIVYLWIIFSVALSHRLRRQSNYFLLSLFADELICIVVITLTVNQFTVVTDVNVLFELYKCIGLITIQGYFLNSAIVAADRYFKIAKPMQYMRLMSDKVCAYVILAVWSLMILILLISFTTALAPTDWSFSSLGKSLTSQAFVTGLAVLTDIIVFPCLTAILIFLVTLVRIARAQQRKIAANVVTCANTATNENQKQGQPLNRRSSKLMWYMSAYFATIIVAWLPTVVLTNVLAFQLQNVTDLLWVAFTIQCCLSMSQMILGALFLTYTQQEHRQVLRNAFKTITNMFKGR